MSTTVAMPIQRGLAFTIILSLVLSALVPMLAPAAARASSHVWINEIHYDNTGTDAGEAIEVAGAADTGLTGWSIVLYNGATGSVYDTDALSGVLIDQQGGFGTAVITYPSNGIQNGSPDGVALVDAAGAVVQFLSYEGTFTAVGGPADGMTSTDIGVVQAGSEPLGDSLQLTGMGTSYADFTWAASQPSTFGNPNTGQAFGSEALPSLDCPGVTTDVGVAASSTISATDADGVVTSIVLTSVTPATDQITIGETTPSSAAGEPATATLNVSATTPAGTYTVEITASTNDDPAQTGTCTLTLSVEEPTALPDGVVISQVYAGGGNSGAIYTNDFIELYNRTDAAVSIEGWSVQYASASGTSWQVTPLTGSVQPGGYYLIGQAAGSGGTTPLPTPDASGSIAMSATNGKVALVPTADPLSGSCPLDATVDFVGYGAANCFEGSAAAPELSNTTAALRAGGGATDTDDNAADFVEGAPNPRNSGGGTQPPGSCDAATHLIHQIQGSDPDSPIEGTDVVIEGVVVGDYQGNDPGLSGFFVQEEDADADGDPLTSEGIFVFDPQTLLDVNEGDVVSVAGQVGEFFEMTQLASVESVTLCGTGDVTPAAVQFPLADVDDLESTEGMLVTIAQTLTVTENFSLGRFGELVLSANGRQYQGTHTADTGAPAEAVIDLNMRSRITLDDGDGSQNDDPTRYPTGGLSAENTLRIGATVTGLTAVMDFDFGLYRLQPVGEITFDDAADRPASPPDVGGRIQVAAFNVLNYFNGDGMGGGFPTARGAETAFEFERQDDKIVAAIAAMEAEVVGLMEIENDGGDAVPAVQTLVDGLNEAVGAGTYAYVETGVIGTDEIAVAVIYQPGEVSPLGDFAILDSSVDPAFDDTENRPVLAQSFTETATGATFTVAVNHLKSKGSGCGPGDDQPEALGGNCNGSRTAAAAALARWLDTDPTASGDPDALIVGDLNSYAMEDPIDELRAAGYTDLLNAFVGPTAYTYVFFGASGYLDYALSSETLTSQVTGTQAWHINTDEPPVLDYNTNFKTPNHVETLYAPDPYRSSDHDPVLVGLALGFEAEAPPEITSLEVTEQARVGQTVELSATYTDANAGDTHTATVNWGDGTVEPVAASGGSVEASHTYASAGLYTVTLTVTDQTGLSDTESFRYVAAYDPRAGFVTGGGRIQTDEGTASFGISIGYRGRDEELRGNLRFSLRDFEVRSTSIDWLVVQDGRAWAHGTATLNREEGYGFLLAVTDRPDRLRLKVTDAETGEVVFDNQPGDPDDAVASERIRNGQIKIHEGKGTRGKGPGRPS